MVNEGCLRVTGWGGVGVQTVNGACQIDTLQAQTDEAGIPGVQAVPALARGEVTDEATAGVDRVDDVGE